MKKRFNSGDSEVVNVRVKLDVLKKLREYAKQDSRTMSDWVRLLIQQEIDMRGARRRGAEEVK